jgi:hypothetical protein
MTATMDARRISTRWGLRTPGSAGSLSRTARVAALLFSVGSLLLAAPGVGSAAPIDEPVGYRDYRMETEQRQQDGDTPAPIHVDGIADRRQAVPLSLDGKRFHVANLDKTKSTTMVSQRSPAPTAKQIGKQDAITTSNFNSFFCGYPVTSVQASPPPPASGNQYAIARAAESLWGYAQAYDAQGGTQQTPHSSTANISFNVRIDIPIDWPQPSQINAYANPWFDGGHYVDSNISPLTFSASSASTAAHRVWMVTGLASVHADSLGHPDQQGRWDRPVGAVLLVRPR